MSEQLHSSETGQGAEYAPLTVEQLEHELPEHATPERTTAEQVNEARSEVAAANETAPQSAPAAEASVRPQTPLLISSELRNLTTARTLSTIRNRLPATDKALSSVIHQPIIRAASNVGAKTVARPSALFTGGLLAFVGSSVYLYLASHIGLTYNYVVAGLLFAAGFVLGIVCEILFGLVMRLRR